jgi:predicted dehydrogenase
MTTNDTQSRPVSMTVIGCGNMARHHLRVMLAEFENTLVPVVCEYNSQQYEETAKVFLEAGRQVPPNEPDLTRLLKDFADELDAAFIITPHNVHLDQASACLKAGLDVLLEKPMVMTAAEAKDLIKIRDETGRLLVVAFNGSLSPQIRTAAGMLRSGEVGELRSISATVWQNWRELTQGTWRQVPELAGGGFLFDTGAHMLNTVTDLAGEEFVEVAAWLDNRGSQVDITGVVLGRLVSGAMVTMHGSGETVPSCASEVQVFCSQAIIRTGVWGERLEILNYGNDAFEPVEVVPSTGAWEQFLLVRRGEMPNPSPPEVGLRMARLWDAIQASATQGGAPVTVS